MGKIGKNAIENLTQSMYNDPRVIYREYIQNSSDQIDIALANKTFPNEKLEIVITIDKQRRNIFIRDNANGISVKNIKRKLEDVADSDKKQGEQKGFRGIGRLGGIGYCHELRFVTSYNGEDTETTMIWDAKRLQEIFADYNNHSSAEEVLDEVVSYKHKHVDKESHYFEVQMLNINEANDLLLDYDNIKQYISEVAPVSFSPKFLLKSKIERFINEHDEIPPMHCYNIGIRKENGEINYVKKEYPSGIYKMVGKEQKRVDEITDVQTDILRNDQGEAIAWIWYTISSFKGVIDKRGNPYRGLRLRQFNIQIGDNTTLIKFFQEDRGNNYFMGEIHTISKEYRPNARRDYFVETPEVKDFERVLREYLKQLTKLYKAASEINSGFKKIEKLKKLKSDFAEKTKKGFSSSKDKEEMERELKDASAKAEEGYNKISKQKSNVNNSSSSALGKVFKAIERNQDEPIKNIDIEKILSNDSLKKIEQGNLDEKREALLSAKKKERPKLLVDELSCFDKKSRKLISQIYGVIQKNLIKEEAEALIEKIQEELKNNK